MLSLLILASLFVAQTGQSLTGGVERRIEIDPSLREILDRHGIPFVEKVHEVDESDVWQTGPYCGANSLYMFLRISGVTVRYEDLKKEVPVSENGASCLELQGCSEKHGVPLEVLSIKPSDIKALGYPIIALLGTHRKGEVVGHFIVVCNETKDGILAVDGTTGNLDRISKPVFNRAFSGYVLARKGRDSVVRPVYAMVNVVLLVGCAVNLAAIASIQLFRATRRGSR